MKLPRKIKLWREICCLNIYCLCELWEGTNYIKWALSLVQHYFMKTFYFDSSLTRMLVWLWCRESNGEPVTQQWEVKGCLLFWWSPHIVTCLEKKQYNLGVTSCVSWICVKCLKILTINLTWSVSHFKHLKGMHLPAGATHLIDLLIWDD